MSHIITDFACFRKFWWRVVKVSGLKGICLFRMSHILTYLSHILTYFLSKCAFECVCSEAGVSIETARIVCIRMLPDRSSDKSRPEGQAGLKDLED